MFRVYSVQRTKRNAEQKYAVIVMILQTTNNCCAVAGSGAALAGSVLSHDAGTNCRIRPVRL